ncbi:MAG TPA: molybdate ABC transporter substrate-binding protein [Gammaproteobacteria bacterium]|nr:molybdate ABC transporter substrate-binding protein [Gammaproteobacteria bacterium]
MFAVSSIRRSFGVWIAAVVLGVGAGPALADQARVAVAANFTAAVKEITQQFEKTSGHKILLSFGSTGQLYTQITQGAPFDVFLAADQARPEKAVAAGLAVKGSRFTYATGKIVLFSSDKTLVSGEETLEKGDFEKIAIANPVTAPYGAAAVEAMRALGVYAALRSKIVEGSNISQTYEFVSTGNAEVGFVALSQVARNKAGSRWIVPSRLYEPLAQDAVLLEHGAKDSAAMAFLAYLKGPKARAIEEKYGYGTGE